MPDIIAIALAVASTMVASIGMVLFKFAAKKEIREMLLNRYFITGSILFVFGTILMILALKIEELSLLFPITSLTYIWVMLLSRQFLGEQLSKWKILAVVFIVFGIILVTQ